MKKTEPEEIIVDSRLSFREAIADTAAPRSIIKELCLLHVHYYAFDGKLHQGQLVAHRRLREELRDIFSIMKGIRFPVAKVIPIVHYQWSDEASMADNNASAFNYRLVSGTTRLSRHASGLAIDINPRQNPVVYADGTSLPPGAEYIPSANGTIVEGPILEAFLFRGWLWGGDFKSSPDYHHFEKPFIGVG